MDMALWRRPSDNALGCYMHAYVIILNINMLNWTDDFKNGAEPLEEFYNLKRETTTLRKVG